MLLSRTRNSQCSISRDILHTTTRANKKSKEKEMKAVLRWFKIKFDRWLQYDYSYYHIKDDKTEKLISLLSDSNEVSDNIKSIYKCKEYDNMFVEVQSNKEK
jgi:hypothetical protein